jgi:hypothetical protein
MIYVDLFEKKEFHLGDIYMKSDPKNISEAFFQKHVFKNDTKTFKLN